VAKLPKQKEIGGGKSTYNKESKGASPLKNKEGIIEERTFLKQGEQEGRSPSQNIFPLSFVKRGGHRG
jgi:hypothetical protein